MLLIGTPLVVTCWRSFIHSRRSSRRHSWSRYGLLSPPIFSNWRSQFKKYRAGGMKCAAWLSFPINNSNASVLIFVEANASFMSMVQAVCFSSFRNTLRDWVFRAHPRHVLCSDSCPSPIILLKESGSSRFRWSYGYSGRKSVCTTNRAALFARSIQCLSSTVMVIMSSMNPSIHASVDVMSTAKGSVVEIWIAEWCFSYCGSKDRCGEFMSSVSQDSSWSRSFPRSIATSLTVLYSAGAGVVPKCNLRQRKSGSYTIAMHVDKVVKFAYIRR